MKVRSGIDAVYIPRIAETMSKRASFIDKCYTEDEREYALSHNAEARRIEIFAGRIAAKEAVAKALGTGIMAEGVGLQDIEIVTTESGAPELKLHGTALAKAEALHVTSTSVSITHEKDYAAAVCMLLCDEEV